MFLNFLSGVYSHHSSEGCCDLIKLNHCAFCKHPFWYPSFTQVVLSRMFFLLPILNTPFPPIHWFSTSGASEAKCEISLHTEVRESLKTEAHHSRPVGGRCNKQGNLQVWLMLCRCEMSWSLYLPTRIFKKRFIRGIDWIQSHILSRWSQQHITISELYPWGSF